MMTRAIYKFPMPFFKPITIGLTPQHKIALFAGQGGTPTIWIDDNHETHLGRAEFQFMIVGTGTHYSPREGWEHVGSYIEENYVWHLLRRLK